ncbi:hypothetical protein J1605_008641 [Eschrichtius robustus]|uniref:Ras association domain-containing protein 3 n=1 Tax=Eschrichtius robustus TaxID=9764 RepID=A0AB34GWF7_ESCRO|nr:hypothetical protein J1605_008641 [Eschrichtius robustus]
MNQHAVAGHQDKRDSRRGTHSSCDQPCILMCFRFFFGCTLRHVELPGPGIDATPLVVEAWSLLTTGPPRKSTSAYFNILEVVVLQDVEKDKETHNYLSKEEIKEKVHKYNLAVTDKLKMTLNSNGIYTGFIKVQMELCKPSQTSGKLAPSSNGCMNTLHISSTNTVGEVIEALLKKFLVTESPTKFALYKRCHREDQVYACKLSDREHPLFLRLVAGPRTDTLSFVLREHEFGEWEAFSLPELQNFLRILDKEEDEQLQNLKERYAAYRHKLEEALSEAWKPG